MRLTTCPSCDRHVRADAGACPFCAQVLPEPASRRAARVGAIIAGVATVSAMTGCPRAATKYGAPPPMPEDRMSTDDEDGADEAAAPTPEEPAPEEQPAPDEQPAADEPAAETPD